MRDRHDSGTLPTDEIIPASRELGEKCLRPGNSSYAALQAIANAEAALGELSANFDAWMHEEVERLDVARAALHRGHEAQAVELLFVSAHNLKGQAGTFGYPMAAEICASLCRLLDAAADPTKLPRLLVDHHVDAVKAIVREHATGADHKVAEELADNLGRATEKALGRARRRAGAART